jgi:hypothetical protein
VVHHKKEYFEDSVKDEGFTEIRGDFVKSLKYSSRFFYSKKRKKSKEKSPSSDSFSLQILLK